MFELRTLLEEVGYISESFKVQIGSQDIRSILILNILIISLTDFLPATRAKSSSHQKTLISTPRAGSSHATQLANFSTLLRK